MPKENPKPCKKPPRGTSKVELALIHRRKMLAKAYVRAERYDAAHRKSNKKEFPK